WAELPFIGIPVQLSPNRNIDISITETDFVDIQLSEPLLPSRGVIMRNQNPDEIPYEIDPESLIDEWYPLDMYQTTDPYIVRDIRGQNIFVYPFKYNAVQNVLRVYTSFTITCTDNFETPTNPLQNSFSVINKEMDPIYKSLFVNYNQNPAKWTNEIGEFGDILVIYTSRDATAIQPYIEWKQQKGHNVYELEVSTGANVVSTIQSEYNSNNNILYVLLVGDWADIKTNTGPSSAPIDPMAGCVVGTDDYFDIIIGRFSANNTGHVTAQVNKTIQYECNPDIGGTWYTKALGIASNEGTGDDGEYDYEQIDNIHDGKLLPFTYTNCYEQYGSSASASGVASYINSGVSVINYCGHGGHDYWVSSGYSTTNANAATNTTEYPFIFSVACVVGEFHTGADCLAEALAKKANGGSVSSWMSTINQPWQPPMRGQDYANDLLVQGYNYSTGPGSGTSTTYGRTTFGSITFNAAQLMISEVSGTDDWNTYKTWTIFGDPAVQVRTDQPKSITVTNLNISPETYTTQIQVEGAAFEGALVSLWQAGSQPASALTDASGNVSIEHSFAGTVKLTVTGFNLATYSEDHVVAVPDPPVCDFNADQTTITAGETVQFTDLSTNYPSVWDWSFASGTPNTSDEQNPSVTYNTPGTYDVYLYVENNAGDDDLLKAGYITVEPITEPPVVDFTADNTTINVGETVNFTDLSTNLPESWVWTFEGGTPPNSTDQNPSIAYNSPGTYNVSLEATNSFGSGDITKNAYITVNLPSYCDAGSNSDDYEYISNVNLADIDKTSGASTYSDFTDVSSDVLIGEEYSFTVTINTDYNNDQILMWADWNRDGDFDDTGEQLYVSNTGQGPFSSTITVPATASQGPVRLRIRLHDSSTTYNPNTTPCGNSGYGEVEDYTLNLISPEMPPTANFTADVTSTCTGIVQFTDLSSLADTWEWDFGDGNTSNEQNPQHTYTADGTYTVSLTVYNAYGDDTHAETNLITVDMPDAPVTTGAENCGPSELTLTATGDGSLSWYESQTGGSSIHEGNSYTTMFSATTTLYVQSEIDNYVTYYAGPEDNSFGGGGYFGNTSYVHGLIFDAYTDFTLVSVWVDAENNKNRVINLKDASDNIIETRTVYIPAGQSRITLNIDVPAGTDYTLECAGDADLYRNNTNASLPYILSNVLSIHGTTANQAGYYYYFYDWEVTLNESCISARTPVTATIHELPTVDLGDDIEQCGGSVTLDAGTGYSS
ncbi:MAG: C25 family cysteine peptidase, partial [Candidatus Carbobacillus sp.]|nr:C25 family cysteine peptidase [Candidatus Carbobacillus sp.]